MVGARRIDSAIPRVAGAESRRWALRRYRAASTIAMRTSKGSLLCVSVAWLGYSTSQADHDFDTAGQRAALNAAYDQSWIYYNLLQPVLHLVEKTYNGPRVQRRWDAAQTPVAHLLLPAGFSPGSIIAVW